MFSLKHPHAHIPVCGRERVENQETKVILSYIESWGQPGLHETVVQERPRKGEFTANARYSVAVSGAHRQSLTLAR